MKLAFKIARRYLFSKKSTNAINIISYISMGGMLVCSAAFILILSVFNGFEGLVVSLYDSFYPDIKVEARQGKTFLVDEEQIYRIEQLPGVVAVSKTMEENALLMYNQRQHTATVKGVDENFVLVSGLDTSMAYGERFVLENNGEFYAVLGSGIDQALEVSLKDPFNRLAIYMPRRGGGTSLFQVDEFRRSEIMTWGIFAIQDDFDNRYIFVPLDFLRNILNYNDEVGALEIGISGNVSNLRVQNQIREILGEDYVVLTKYQQNAFLYRIMNIEKLAVYLILSFVFLIVAFNMIGSLSMVVIDKKQDIGILKTMGANDNLIRQIFILEGMLQAVFAVIFGFLIAVILLLVQQKFGLIQIQGSGTFVVQHYPVRMKTQDFILVSIIVLGISAFASYFPANKASRQAQATGNVE